MYENHENAVLACQIQLSWLQTTKLHAYHQSYLEKMGILGILDTRGKILETGGILGEFKKIVEKIEKKLNWKIEKKLEKN